MVAILVAIAGVVYAQRSLSTKTAWKDVTIKYKVTFDYPNSKIKEYEQQVRHIRANGDWKETQTVTDADGTPLSKPKVLVAGKDGLFRVRDEEQKLSFKGNPIPAGWIYDVQKEKASPNFVDEVEIAGVSVIHTRAEKPGGGSIDVYRSPLYNGAVIKQVDAFPDGVVITKEAFEVTPGKVSDEVFGKRPDYPVEYSDFDKALNGKRQAAPKEE